MWPSRWKWATGQRGALTGRRLKFVLPSRLSLGVEVGEVAALEQRVVGEVDARRDVLGHERDLLDLGEHVVHHPVQRHGADGADGDEAPRG